MPYSEEAAINGIKNLIDDFKQNYQKYKSEQEANIETKLIEPLFALLGWATKDFEKRPRVHRGEKRGFADYAFKINDRTVFFLEAKRIGISLDREADKQVISYALSKRIPFAVSTNFEELKIFCVEQENAVNNVFRVFNKPEEYISDFHNLLLLSKQSFEKGLTLEKAESENRLRKRISIDKPLLEDLMHIRSLLANDIEKNYPKKYNANEKDEIIQRIIDRLIFIRRCEDTQINPNNIILEEVRSLPHDKAYPKLKWIFSKYNTIFNSGLFLIGVDNDCDMISINGEIIKNLISYLYKSRDGQYIYNFDWIDADVLGQVYEQYLGKILQQKRSGKSELTDNQVHKKESGIYYTPIYIVDYIVKNAINIVLNEKKINPRKLRILDPACGSGSFLIKAFDELYNHIKNNEDVSQRKLDSQGIYSIKTEILKNNIFGIDLDKKAVEIAKLNLLLKTADGPRKLPEELDLHIRQGNSLIDDDKVAGLDAFKWEKEFKQIIDEGGFDIIIGNPPYIRIQTLGDNDVDFFNSHYESATKNYDIYALFVEKSLKLLKEGGILGFILPSKFFNADYGAGLRKVIAENKSLYQIVDFKDFQVFGEATTYTCLLFLRNGKNKNFDYYSIVNKDKVRLLQALSLSSFDKSKQEQPNGDESWSFVSENGKEIMKELNDVELRLGDVAKNIFQGLVTGADKFYFVYVVEDKGKLVKVKNKYDGKEHIIEKSSLKKLLKGKEVRKWFVDWQDIYIVYPYLVQKDNVRLIPIDEIKKEYPKTYDYFVTYEKELRAREDNRFKDEKNWHQFGRLQNIEKFEQSKIITQVLASRNSFTFDENGEYYFVGGGNAGGYGIVLKESYKNDYYLILALLNSKILEFYLKNISTPFRGGFYSYGKRFIEKLPIILPSDKEKIRLIELSKMQLKLNKLLGEFENKKTDYTAKMQKEIEENDNEINEIVYKIYGITEDEKIIVEKS